MNPKQDIKKLLKVNFIDNDSYYEIKTKLVALERIICYSLDQNVIEGAFTKIMTLFITRNKTIKRACIPHYRRVRRYVKNIPQDITHLFYINDKDIVKIILKFVRIFAKFYCRNSVVIYYVLHAKNKYKYKVMNDLISRNDNLLGLFDYNTIFQDSYVKMSEVSDTDDNTVKRFKPSQNQLTGAHDTNIHYKKYLKTLDALKEYYLDKNKSDVFEFLKVGELDHIEHSNVIEEMFTEIEDLKRHSTDSCISSRFTNKMTKDDFKTEIERLKSSSENYTDYIICSYFFDLIEGQNECDSKYVFDIKDGVISSSFLMSFYSLLHNSDYLKIKKVFTRLFHS